MVTPSEKARTFPDHTWFEGKVASWENRKEGFVWLFEVVVDPPSFREVVNSPGNPEIVELYKPKLGQILRFTFLNDNDYPVGSSSVRLDENNTSITLQLGDRFIMDATETTADGPLAHTCICQGVTEL